MHPTVWGEEPERVKGQSLRDDWHGWRYGQDRRTGQPFFIIDGSEPGTAWYTDANDCTCPDRRYRRHVCKHMVAVRLWCRDLISGAIDSHVVTATDRGQLIAGMAMAYDLDLAEQADTLLEQYGKHLAEAQEALVDPDEPVGEALANGPTTPDNGPDDPWNDPGYPWTDVEPSGADDGRPVWLEAGDAWGPDTRRPVPLTTRGGPQGGAPSFDAGRAPQPRPARIARAVEPSPDRRDVARHRSRRAPFPPAGSPRGC